jgi:hypothetical protein
MKSQFKLAAIALALVSSSSAFAADIDPTTILIGTPVATDVDSAATLFDGAANSNDYDRATGIIAQTGDANVAVIDQTGTGLAIIAQAGNTSATGYIIQVDGAAGAGSTAAIIQR